jgi:uncharacterized protein with FMN-binding domain
MADMLPNQNSNRDTILKIIAGVAVLGIAGIAFSKIGNEAELESVTTNSPSTESVDQATVNSNSKYKDGTYTSEGEYTSPAGQEEVEVTVTLQGDVVTDVSFVDKASNPGSVKNQELFSQGFEQLVVGKSIDSIELGVVNGSSLTPKGFMDAIAKIKVEAGA